MAILITGGAGFIGINFILDWVVYHPDEIVINLDKLTYAGQIGHLDELRHNLRYHFIRGDISDSQLIHFLLTKYKIRAVIHFAAETHVDRSIHHPECFIQTNIVGTFQLLETVLKYYKNLDNTTQKEFRFLHISTDEVYGALGTEEHAFTEESAYKPNNPYSASKAASNHMVRAYYQTYGLPVLTTNCSNNYGPYQFTEKFIPSMIHCALKNKPLPIYGDGLQIRDWLYVGDHCHAIRKILHQGQIGEVYNIGGKHECTNLEVAQFICKILDKEKPLKESKSYACQIMHIQDRLGHDRRYAIDFSKLNRELGWVPQESFETGILKTVRWYIQNMESLVEI